MGLAWASPNIVSLSRGVFSVINIHSRLQSVKVILKMEIINLIHIHKHTYNRCMHTVAVFLEKTSLEASEKLELQKQM